MTFKIFWKIELVCCTVRSRMTIWRMRSSKKLLKQSFFAVQWPIKNLILIDHSGRVYALTRVGTLLTRVTRKRRGFVPEC